MYSLFSYAEIGALAGGLVDSGIARWMAGAPRSEEALMNQVTQALGGPAYCDIGRVEPLILSAEVYPLHRRGPGRTDAYGSDAAVTVIFETTGVVKTAFFQFKKAPLGQCRLERGQLRDALRHPAVAPRAFIFAADENSGEARIASARWALGQFRPRAATRTTTIAPWIRTRAWIAGWLACRQAPASDLHARDRVEALLQPFVDARIPPDILPGGAGPDPIVMRDMPDGFQPARLWAVLRLSAPMPGTLG